MSGDKKFFFIAAFILIFSFLADFCFKNSLIDFLQKILYWPSVTFLILLLVSSRGFFHFSFSKYSLILILIIAAGLFIRLYRIDLFVLHGDEYETLCATKLLSDNGCSTYAFLPISFFYGKIPSLSSLPYYLTQFFFDNPLIVARLPSIIAGISTIWLTYRFVKEGISKGAALLSAFFLAIFPWHIIQSRVGVRAILTPFFGVLIFYLFIKAIKKKKKAYLFLSVLALSIGAFWTYTASQVYIIVYLMCCLAMFKELYWIKPLDACICVLIFFIPLYPSIVNWSECSLFKSQYYHSAINSSSIQQPVNLIKIISSNLKNAFMLFIYKKDHVFKLFAPTMCGPIIEPLLILPMFLSLLYGIKQKQRFYKIIIVWLIAGFFCSVAFLNKISARHFLAILPIFPILAAGFLFLAWGIFKKFNILLKSFGVFCVVALVLTGEAFYLKKYYYYINHIQAEDIYAYGFDFKEVADFFSKDPNFIKTNNKVVLDLYMGALKPYFNYLYCGKKGYYLHNFSGRFMEYSRSYSTEEIISNRGKISYWCLWPLETRKKSFKILHQAFKEFYPGKLPDKIIYYPNGYKAIEIYHTKSANRGNLK